MVSKKQSRAAQRRRNQEFQARIDKKRARAQVRNRVVSAVAIGSLVAGGGVFAAFSFGAGGSDPVVTQPAATLVATATPAAGIDTGDVAPDPATAEAREWTATVDTNLGPLTLALDGAAAPQAVASFVHLADLGFFDGVQCHRLTTAGIYVLQCGDPTGSGSGGPDYRFGPIENAPADDVYPAGTVAMARVGNSAESMGSQFFLVYADSMIPSDAAGGYTVFGTVADGLAIVEDVAAAGTTTGGTDGSPAQTIVMNEVSVS